MGEREPLREEERYNSFMASANVSEGKASGDPDGLGGRFECNICLEDVREPIVTQCGHLYCW